MALDESTRHRLPGSLHTAHLNRKTGHLGATTLPTLEHFLLNIPRLRSYPQSVLIYHPTYPPTYHMRNNIQTINLHNGSNKRTTPAAHYSFHSARPCRTRLSFAHCVCTDNQTQIITYVVTLPLPTTQTAHPFLLLTSRLPH